MMCAVDTLHVIPPLSLTPPPKNKTESEAAESGINRLRTVQPHDGAAILRALTPGWEEEEEEEGGGGGGGGCPAALPLSVLWRPSPPALRPFVTPEHIRVRVFGCLVVWVGGWVGGWVSWWWWWWWWWWCVEGGQAHTRLILNGNPSSSIHPSTPSSSP